MDYNLFNFINSLVGKWLCLDSLAIFFAKYLIYYLVVGAIFVFFLVKTKKEKIRYLFLAGASVILSRLFITEAIRLIWYRPRPFVNHQVNLLIEHSASGSFPSGHIAFLFALSAAIYLFGKKICSQDSRKILSNISIVFFVLSFLVGLSRIFVGLHYPLDIFGGIVVGFFSTWIIFLGFSRRFVS